MKREEEKRPKDSDIKELKNRIKRTVNQFIEDHPQLDVQKQTTISSAFKYLDFNLKNKIITLYKEHQEVVNTISSLKRFPSINSETIESFVKLRNCKTHSGAFEWGDNAKLYPVLLILVYAELFQYIGLSTNEIIGLLERVF